MDRQRLIAGTLALVLLAVAGCGDDSTASDGTPASSADIPVDEGFPEIVSQSARLKFGSSAEILNTPSIKVTTVCSERQVDVFVTNKGGTADAVVTTQKWGIVNPSLDPGKPLSVPMPIPGMQTWTIASFAEVSRPTVLTVGSRDTSGDKGTPYDCGVIGQAVTGAETPVITETKPASQP